MWRKVTWAQVLNVGGRPSTVLEMGKVSLGCHGTEGSRGDQRTSRLYAPNMLTFIPPPLAHTEVFAILGSGDLAAVLAFHLRHRVVGLTSAFFHQGIARTICDVSFRRYRRSFANFARNLKGRSTHERNIIGRGGGSVFFLGRRYGLLGRRRGGFLCCLLRRWE